MLPAILKTMKMLRQLISKTLYSIIGIVFFFISCSDNRETKTVTTATKIIEFDTLELMFPNLEVEDSEEEKKLALASVAFTLTKLKSKRKFNVFQFSTDSIHNVQLIKKLREIVKEIKTKKDTVNGIQVLFADNTPIKYFVKAYRLFIIEEKPYCVTPTINEGIFAWYMDKKL